MVSDIGRQHGGAICEFSGDGMMLVFGAPEPLPQKECAAVEAGRQMHSAVRSLKPAGDPDWILSIGVGIASGTAFVGSVQTADQLIWTALGTTANLAARLQSITRELDAAIAIDNATYEGGSAAVRGFCAFEGVFLRGLAELQTVYVLPLDTTSKPLGS
jgi:class 3 adenylate cyclase